MEFELFDPKAEVRIREEQLPHWFQPGVTYFVTFRTDDSVPQALSRDWHQRREVWLRRQGIDSSAENWKSALRQRPELEREYHNVFTPQFMEYLDRGYGKCLLRDQVLAAVVSESLRHSDGTNYRMGDFIVMPNHVHLLTCLLGATDIEQQCRSWKRYTATRINRILSQRGRFWQAESFDHLVRSPEQFEYLQRYIAENPNKAGLPPGDYLHYRSQQ